MSTSEKELEIQIKYAADIPGLRFRHYRGEADHAAVQAGSERHQAALTEALEHLQSARLQVAAGGSDDLVAEELRLALHGLAALVGTWTPEDLLDRLFAQFCVGK